jgi:hypothetical protein
MDKLALDCILDNVRTIHLEKFLLFLSEEMAIQKTNSFSHRRILSLYRRFLTNIKIANGEEL